jgi:hypothetical protein
VVGRGDNEKARKVASVHEGVSSEYETEDGKCEGL